MPATVADVMYWKLEAAYATLKNIPEAQKIIIATSMPAPDSFGTLVNLPLANVTIAGQSAADGKVPELQGGLGAHRLAYGKAILNIETAGNVTVENLIFSGARSADSNGAGIRVNGASSVYLTVKSVIMRNNENGILSTAPTVSIVASLFDNNGHATNVDRRGYSHNVYMAGDLLTVQRSTFINSEFGHDFKSRCKVLDMRQTFVGGSKQGRAMDLPESGIVYVENCVFSKPATATQNCLIQIGEEGAVGGRPEKFTFKNCEFKLDIEPARDVMFIHNHRPVVCELIDCKFTGAAATKDRTQTLRGQFKETLTGGPLGPVLPVGVPNLIQVQPMALGATASLPISEPAPIPAPPQPLPTPAPAPAPTPAPTPAPVAVSPYGPAAEKAAIAFLRALGYKTITK